ncbi:MAG: threonine/serine exporter family protein [Propionibacteriaceae bacterium]|nr:threonine/serine exporter family protein [Propionibacteriaceae bacterium]
MNQRPDDDTGILTPDAQMFRHVSMSELGLTGQLPSTTEGLAVELTLRIGDLLFGSGMSTQDTILTMRRILTAYGLARAQVDITHTSIIASYYPGGGLPPITSVRIVKTVVANLSKVETVGRLVEEIVRGKPLGDAMRALDAIRATPLPYPVWVAILGESLISVSIQLMYTTSPRMLLIALVTGVLLNLFMRAMMRFALPPFFLQLSGAWLAVGFAAFASWANGRIEFFDGVDPTLVALGCLWQLVAGMKFVAAVQDAIDTNYVTATARLLQVVMLTGGIVAGLVSGLIVLNRFGLEVYISATPLTQGALPVQVIGATALAAVYLVGNYANGRTIVLASAMAALARVGYAMTLTSGFGPIASNFVGAFAAALLATLLVRKTAIPGFAIVAAAMIPLVPGSRLYYAMIQMVGTVNIAADMSLGINTLGVALGIGLAIAAGASVGVFFGRPIGDRLMTLPRTWYDRMRTYHKE